MTLAPHARALDSRQPSGVGLRVAVVIPCRNEALYVAGLLNALRAQDSPIDDIIVVDGGSVDGTMDLVREFGARHPDFPPPAYMPRSVCRGWRICR